MPGDDNNPAQNNAVALKLPTFWSHQPRVWFAQAEAQFTLHGVTVDSTKYSYLIAALPEDVATRALDYIESKADSDSMEKYKGLKARLLGPFTPSDYEQAGMLTNGPDLATSRTTNCPLSWIGCSPSSAIMSHVCSSDTFSSSASLHRSGLSSFRGARGT